MAATPAPARRPSTTAPMPVLSDGPPRCTTRPTRLEPARGSGAPRAVRHADRAATPTITTASTTARPTMPGRATEAGRLGPVDRATVRTVPTGPMGDAATPTTSAPSNPAVAAR